MSRKLYEFYFSFTNRNNIKYLFLKRDTGAARLGTTDFNEEIQFVIYLLGKVVWLVNIVSTIPTWYRKLCYILIQGEGSYNTKDGSWP